MGIQVTHDFSKILTTPGTRLIIGLGNIGDEYVKTRHNAGFMAVEAFVESHDLGVFTYKSNLSANILETRLGDTKLIIAKPTTLMNLSGQAVIALQDYFNLDPSQIVVVHDDIDLEFGKIRTKIAGGNGGHNGLKSIDNAIGEDYMRIKIGVKNEIRDKMDAGDFVLKPFSKEELAHLIQAWTITNQLIEQFVSDQLKTESISFL